jgi:ribosomal protein L19E
VEPLLLISEHGTEVWIDSIRILRQTLERLRAHQEATNTCS